MRSVAAAVLAVAVFGCRPAALPTVEDPARVIDLVAQLEGADRGTLRSRWRLADPEFAPRRLGGWDAPETDATGAFVWALGERASLDLLLDRRRPLTLRLACRGWSEDARGEVTLSVAGREIGSGALAGLEEVELVGRLEAAPRTVPTRLDLRFAAPRDPTVDDGVDDARALGARCTTLSIAGDAEGTRDSLGDSPSADGTAHVVRHEAPRRDGPPESKALELPPGAWVRWDLELPAGSVLEHGAVEVPEGLALWYRLVVASSTPDLASAPDAASQTDSNPGGAWGPLSKEPRRLLEATDTDRVFRLELLSVVESRREANAVDASPSEGIRLETLRRVDAPRSVEAPRPVDAPVAGGEPERETDTHDPQAVPRSAARPGADDALAPPWNVLLYVVDTLRADRLGRRPESLTPALDRFAAESAVFEQARAQTSWTRPAVASILTGRVPGSHGVEDRHDGLAPSVTTLAERLHAAGWATGAWITNGNVGPGAGLAQGFESFRHLEESSERVTFHVPAPQLHGRALGWLDARHEAGDERPFFLYLHATDPHAPYTPTASSRERFAPGVDPALGGLESMRPLVTSLRRPAPGEAAALAALYDAEVADFDAAFGSLWRALEERGLHETTVVVFVSDHGEEFFEHGGWEHGRTLYEEQLRVPLILRLPGHEPLVSSAAADQVDVVPTLLELLGLPEEPGLDGRSLLPALRTPSAPSQPLERPSLAELRLEGADGASLLDRREGGLKVIEGLGPRRAFDLTDDPGEERDLVQAKTEAAGIRAGVLAQQLRRLRAEATATAPRAVRSSIDEETRKRLEALGYVQ